jgi:hypothetical protein
MRQVQRPSARARKPAPTAGPAHLEVRPAVRCWLERLTPSAGPWPHPTIPTHREGR